jgi:hypothetical protein
MIGKLTQSNAVGLSKINVSLHNSNKKGPTEVEPFGFQSTAQ